MVDDVFLVPREPCIQFMTVRSLECTPYTILADDAFETEKRCEYCVVPQPVDVYVPRGPADDCEHNRADNITDFRRIRACVMERSVFDEQV